MGHFAYSFRKLKMKRNRIQSSAKQIGSNERGKNGRFIRSRKISDVWLRDFKQLV